MKKILTVLALAAAVLGVSCDRPEEPQVKPTLTVSPSELAFAASGNSSKTVTVTAENVGWEITMSDESKAWITVTENSDGKTLTVSVSDNEAETARNGSFTLTPDNVKVDPKRVTVSQEGAEVGDLSFSLDPTALTFDGEGAPAQEVVVAVSDAKLTWTAAPEEAAKDWITVTASGDKISVSVADNPDTTERSGNVIVTPDTKSVNPKAVRVTQKGKVLPPSLSINVEDPETGFKFQASGVQYEGASNIQVTAVNTDWNARAVDADGNAITWLKITVNKNDGLSSINVDVTKNETYEERVGYVLITATVEGVPEIRVTVTQDAAREHFSTLSGNVDVSKLVYSYAEVNPNQDWEEADMGAGWYVYLYSEGLTEDNGVFTGTGTYIMLEMSAEHMGFNDDKEYYLSEGTYEIYTDESGQRGPQMTYTKGYPGYFDYQNFGSWALVVENGEIVEKGPCAAGTVTVSRSGDSYTFTLDIEDDMQYAVSGTTTVEFSRVKVLSDPVPQPPTGFQ